VHPVTDRFPPGREGVERLFEALRGVPEGALVFLDRRYDPGEQARRDGAWERVLDEATFRHRDGAIDEIRAAAIQHVTLSRSRGLESTSYGLTPGGPLHRPEAQARVVNAIIEAAGAILVADLVEDQVVDVLAGPVLDLLATLEDERAAAEAEAERRRRDPYGLAGD